MTHGREPLAGITVLRVLREDIEQQSSRLAQEEQGLDSPSPSSLVDALNSRCWLSSGGNCLLLSKVRKDLLKKNDPRCKFL